MDAALIIFLNKRKHQTMAKLHFAQKYNQKTKLFK